MNLLARYKKFSNENSSVDICRKVIFYVMNLIGSVLILGRRIRFLFLLKKWNINVGKRVIVKGLPINIKIGDNCDLYDQVVIELIRHDAQITFGNKVLLSYGVLVSCSCKIAIGNSVQVGEYSSIRDSTHSYKDLSKPMREAADSIATIIIGNDVWIGRNCIIMPGTIIEDGVVVGANSIVKGTLKENGIYAGSPVKLLKMRTQDGV